MTDDSSSSLEERKLLLKIEKLLLEIQKLQPETQLEERKLQLEIQKIQLELYRLEREDKREGYRATDMAGRDAAKAPGIVNAGAALATLTFIGNFVTKESFSQGRSLVPALAAFCAGVLIALVATGTRFLTLAAYRVSDQKGNAWNRVTIGIVVSSYVAFIAGCIFAASALLNVEAKPKVGAAHNSPKPPVESRAVAGPMNPTEAPTSTVTPTLGPPTRTPRASIPARR